jgi:hypothetical protein
VFEEFGEQYLRGFAIRRQYMVTSTVHIQRRFAVQRRATVRRRLALTTTDYNSATICTYGEGLYSMGSMVGMAMEPRADLIACILRLQKRCAESPLVQYSYRRAYQTYEKHSECVRLVGHEEVARIVGVML